MEVVREPPMTWTVMGFGSLLETSRTARVGWPLTSLTPKISACGKLVLMSTARFGVWSFVSSPSSSEGISWMSSIYGQTRLVVVGSDGLDFQYLNALRKIDSRCEGLHCREDKRSKLE
jgi:hypothetical protein